MRISDWSSDVCSSDLLKSVNRAVDVIAEGFDLAIRVRFPPLDDTGLVMRKLDDSRQCLVASPGLISSPVTSPVDLSRFPSLDLGPVRPDYRSEEHTSELQSLMRISYAVFCLKKKKKRH